MMSSAEGLELESLIDIRKPDRSAVLADRSTSGPITEGLRSQSVSGPVCSSGGLVYLADCVSCTGTFFCPFSDFCCCLRSR